MERFAIMMKTTFMLLVAVVMFSLTATEAQASHFRYGTVSWRPTGAPGEVEFRIKVSYRRTFDSGLGGPIGGTFTQDSFDFGDDTFDTPVFTITSFSDTDDFTIGEATLTHTYPASPTSFTASYGSCCRISNLNNTGSGSYRFATLVTPGGANSSPDTSLPPIVTVGNSNAASFVVPASDVDRDPLRFRVASATENGGVNPPPNFTINPSTGQVTWDTTGLNQTNFWTAQIVIEDLDANGNIKSTIAIDFLLQIRSSVGMPPTVTINPPGPLSVRPNTPVTFTVTGNDPDPNSRVTLNASGVPTGATLSPSLGSAMSPPVTSTFNWTPTPADAGSYTITFTATDDTFQQALASINIFVENNDPPTISCPPPVTVQSTSATGTSVPLSVQVQDANGDALTVTWNVDGSDVQTDNVAASTTPATVMLTRNYAPGTHNVIVTVSDAKAAPVSCSTTVQVLPPAIETPIGNNVTVQMGNATIIFANVTAAGTTSIAEINPASAGTLPFGYTLTGDSRASDISTTATVSGLITVCLAAPTVFDPLTLSRLRLLHGESNALVDRTASVDSASRSVCAQVTSLSPFVLAQAPVQTLSGRITNASGASLSGVSVMLNVFQSNFSSGLTLAPAITGDDGSYQFTVAAGGDYTVMPTLAGVTFSPPSHVFSRLSGNQTGNFVAQTAVSISGRVTNRAGGGVAGVLVTLTGAVSQATRTLGDGTYSFTNLPPNPNGVYTVIVEDPTQSFDQTRRDFSNLTSDAVFNIQATRQPSPTPPPPIRGDFEGPQVDRNIFNFGTLTTGATDPAVLVFQEGGQLKINPRENITDASFNGLVTVRAVDFNDTRASVEVVQSTDNGAQTVFGVGSDTQNFFRFIAQDPDVVLTPSGASNAKVNGDARRLDTGSRQLIFQTRIGGALSSVSVAYNPVQHRFWRFRHDAPSNTMFFETSPQPQGPFTIQRRLPLSGDIGVLATELSAGTAGAVSKPGQAIFDNLLVQPSTTRSSTLSFAGASYQGNEGDGKITINVRRAGVNVSSASSVVFATEPSDARPCAAIDSKARARCDFETTVGQLTFAPGETEKSFSIFLTDDAYVEGTETFRVALSNASGGFGLADPFVVTVTITDNDSNPAAANPLSRPEFFVRQQYLDFLSREPEPAGFNAWVNVMRQCAFEGNFGPGKTGSDATCDRIMVSSSFFRSQEFQLKGFFVYRFYKASLGRQPTYEEFLRDMSNVSGETDAEVNARREAFADLWVSRTDFRALMETVSNADYVDQLAARAGITIANREALVNDLNAGRRTRAQALRAVVDSPELFDREFNPAFVLIQYFGYLQRDPDPEGYESWLEQLNATGDFRTMIFGFLYSREYISRFGPPIN